MNKIIFNNLSKFLLVLLFLSVRLDSQNIKPAEELTPKLRIQTVNKICKILTNNYVFPETAEKIMKLLKLQQKNNAYDTIKDPVLFADVLTNDLQSVSHDKHLRVRYNPESAMELIDEKNNGPDPESEKKFMEMMKKENYGFKKVECLMGNIGYVDFRNFAPADFAKETIESVMEFLANTDAIIFDIRLNGGGSPDGVRLICSYLFGDKPVHLNDLYFRLNDETEEFWTLKKVDGKKMPDIPVYILTSSYTFSGAEEFAYNLKNLKRAVIVGETTGGGAHPGDIMPVNKSFVIFVPSGRAINPITKTNWEGTGVAPDVQVPSEKALEKAQILALEKLIELNKDDKRKNTLKWIKESIQAVMDAPEIDANTLKKYAGIYKDRTISYENGLLYYKKIGRAKYQMIPMGDDTFMFRDLEFFRIKFVKDDYGNIIELNGLYDDGSVDKSPRTN